MTTTEYVFSAKYKNHSFVLNQPDQEELIIFDDHDLVFLRLPLTYEDDLVKAISVAKEEVDQL